MIIIKLDISCVRDILLTVEKYEGFLDPVVFSRNNYIYYDTFLSDYPIDKILYHVQYCIKANLLSDSSVDISRFYCSLNPSGHDFLANTRTEEKWTRTKSILSKIGGASLQIVSAAAEGVTNAIMDKYLAEEISKIV